MAQNRYRRQTVKVRPEWGLGRMLLCSLGIHLAALVIFSGVWSPARHPPKRPVYYVDLLHKAVERPQAGRPDAPSKTVAKPKPKPKPAVKTAAPKPKPEPKPAVKVAKPAPKPKPKPSAVAKPAPKPAPAVSTDRQLSDTLEDLRRQQEAQKRKEEMEALKAKLAALAAGDRPAPATKAPVGMPEGSGDQAGIAWEAWLQEYLKQSWRLSRYQVGRRDLEAVLTLVFDAEGRLLDYRMTDPSGDRPFDDSVKRAVLRLKDQPLPQPPGRRLEQTVVFNLKDLLE